MDFIGKKETSLRQSDDEVIAGFYSSNQANYKEAAASGEAVNTSIESNGIVISENYIKESSD